MSSNKQIISHKEFDAFVSSHPTTTIVDSYKDQVTELFFIQNPKFRFEKEYQNALQEFQETLSDGQEWKKQGSWFYFPWRDILVHYLPEELFFELRTARNKNIIMKEEQEKLRKAYIGIAGLSVGSHVLTVLTMMSIGQRMKLADPDVVSTSNLNRIKYDMTHIGLSKCQLGYEYLSQANPYVTVEKFSDGVSKDNMEQFLGEPKLDILIEEMDDLEMKIRIRFAAKKLGIPVVMATDNGDNVIVDIERYDLDPTLPIFNGLIGDITIEEFESFNPRELPRLTTKIVGEKLIVPRMLASLQEVGKTLYSWPQLGDAATLSGVAATYAAKRILLGESIQTGKLEINLDSIFQPK